MYKKKHSEQITFYDYNQGFGFPINPENRWVLLANKIPWDKIEQMYAPMFDREDGRQMGNVAISARVAFGALAIRRILHLSDRATVKAIQEGPYLQYFLGMSRYEDKPPFDPSMMSYFRRRLDLDAMGNITDMIIQFEKKREPRENLTKKRFPWLPTARMVLRNPWKRLPRQWPREFFWAQRIVSAHAEWGISVTVAA